MPSQTDDQVTKKRFLRLGIGSLLFDSRVENVSKCPPPPSRTLEKSQTLGHSHRPNEFVRIRRWKSVRYIWSRACLICLITATRSIETGILSNYRTIHSFLKISVTFHRGGGWQKHACLQTYCKSRISHPPRVLLKIKLRWEYNVMIVKFSKSHFTWISTEKY